MHTRNPATAAGERTAAITRIFDPHRSQQRASTANTRRDKSLHAIRLARLTRGLSCEQADRPAFPSVSSATGTTYGRHAAHSASRPWQRSWWARGGGTCAASRAMNSRGSSTSADVPSRHRCRSWYGMRPSESRSSRSTPPAYTTPSAAERIPGQALPSSQLPTPRPASAPPTLRPHSPPPSRRARGLPSSSRPRRRPLRARSRGARLPSGAPSPGRRASHRR